MREVRRAALQAQKNCKETLPRARRLTKEMLLYWKKYEKVEKEHRKRAEKEALEQRKLDEEMREVKQKHRLLIINFLIKHRNDQIIWVSKSGLLSSVVYSISILLHVFLFYFKVLYIILLTFARDSKKPLNYLSSLQVIEIE